MLTIFCAAALTTLDPWDLKAPLTPKSKLTWSQTIKASDDNGEHDASMVFEEDPLDQDTTKGQAVKLIWRSVRVDGQDLPDSPDGWSGWLTPRNVLTVVDGDDNLRRMLAPLMFCYPDKPVSVGDTWKVDTQPSEKDAKKWTGEFTVKEVTKEGDADALHVSEHYAEDGAEGTKSDADWWIGKDGKVIRYEIKLTNWQVPMAGGNPVRATIKGKAVSAGS